MAFLHAAGIEPSFPEPEIFGNKNENLLFGIGIFFRANFRNFFGEIQQARGPDRSMPTKRRSRMAPGALCAGRSQRQCRRDAAMRRPHPVKRAVGRARPGEPDCTHTLPPSRTANAGRGGRSARHRFWWSSSPTARSPPGRGVAHDEARLHCAGAIKGRVQQPAARCLEQIVRCPGKIRGSR
jgi:hypothetical protein